nr:hypothetical protein [Prevotella sp.]
MKKLRLVFATIVAAASVNAVMAQKVEKPTLSFTNLQLNDKDSVFLYNVKSGMFLCAGNNYGTRTSLSNLGTAIAPIKNMVNGIWNGTYTIWNHTKTSNGAYQYPAWNKMFVDNFDVAAGGASYMDYGSAEGKVLNWVIYPIGDGVYQIAADTISGSATDPAKLGPSRFGWDGTEGSTIVSPILLTDAENVSNYGLDWKVVKGDTIAMQSYNERCTLYTLINEAVDKKLDVTSYAATYNNANATLAELQAVEKSVSSDIANAAILQATADNPVDVTSYFIKNAVCGSLSDWTTEGAATNKWAFQNKTGGYTNGDVNINQFIERWVQKGSTLEDGRIYQTLTDLPTGSYKLFVDVIALDQNNETATHHGSWIFAKTTEGGDSTECSTLNEKPQEFTVSARVSDGKLTIGFEQIKTTCNWIAMDNYKLMYYGNSNAALVNELNSLITTEETFIQTAGCNENVYETFVKVISDAKTVANNASSTADDISKSISELKTARKVVDDNIAAYVKLSEAITKANTIAEYDSETYPAVTDLINFMGACDENADPVSDVNDGHMLGTDDVLSIVDKLNVLMVKTTNSSIKAGKDITTLLSDPSFDNKGAGWSGLKTVNNTYFMSEAYETKFDTYQTLNYVPNGVYTLKAQGFQRLGKNDDAFANYKEGKGNITAFLYINQTDSKLKNVYDDRSTNITIEGNAYSCSDGNKVPNDIQSTKSFMDGGLYENEVVGFVSDGVLRLGVKCDSYATAYWSIFDNFRLTYNGDDAATLSTLLNADEYNALKAEPMSKDSLDNLNSTYNTAVAGATVETIQKYIDAKVAATNSAATYATLTNVIALAKDTVTNNVRSNDATTAFNSAKKIIDDKISSGSYADADIANAIINVKSLINQYLIYDDAKVATATSPKDVTYVVANSNFANNTCDNWTLTKSSGNTSIAYHCNEFWNANTFDLHQLIYGLPAGNYKLVVKGFYRDGNNVNDTHVQNALAYVNDVTSKIAYVSEGARDTTGMNLGFVGNCKAFNGKLTPNNMQTAEGFFKCDAAGAYDAPVEYTLSTVGNMTIGVKKDVTLANDWCIFGGFTLYYYGQDATDISNIGTTDSDVASVAIYDINGIKRNTLIKGLNIIKKTMTDGTVNVSKVIIK